MSSNTKTGKLFKLMFLCGNRLPGILFHPLADTTSFSYFQVHLTLLYWSPLHSFQWNTWDLQLRKESLFELTILRIIAASLYASDESKVMKQWSHGSRETETVHGICPAHMSMQTLAITISGVRPPWFEDIPLVHSCIDNGIKPPVITNPLWTLSH